MLRPLLIKATARAKSLGVSDVVTRYNPVLLQGVNARLKDAREQAEENPLHAGDGLLRHMLHAAQKTVYGRGRPDQLAEWPVLHKDALRARPQDFVNPGVRLRVPAGTGGTTGVPLKLWRSLPSIVAEQQFIDELLAPYGLSMRSKMAVLRADNIKPPGEAHPPFGKESHGGNRFTLSSAHLSPKSVQWYHEALSAFRPQILWAYPNSTVNLLKLFEQNGFKLNVPVIITSSETLPSPVHRALEAYFNAKVINYYGQAERVCFAYSKNADEFYFQPLYGRVELGEPEAYSPGKQAARIVATNFWNDAMPLIRYDTGDFALVPEGYGRKELEEIAFGLRPFLGLAGRDGEYILTREGMRIVGLNQIPREVANIYQMQLVQHDYARISIHVIPMPGYGEKDEADILAHARAKIPTTVDITISPVERLRTTERGKTPLVVRDIAEA